MEDGDGALSTSIAHIAQAQIMLPSIPRPWHLSASNIFLLQTLHDLVHDSNIDAY